MKRWNLTRKFLAGILATLVLVFSVMSVSLTFYEKNSVMADMNRRGKNLVHFLATIGAEPIVSFNYIYLENYVRDISANDAEIVYAQFLDKQGQALTQLDEKHAARAKAEKEYLLEFTTPVMQNGEQIGMAKIVLSTLNSKAKLRESQLIILGLAAASIVGISLVFYLLFRRLALRPLGKLKGMLEKVADGDLTETLEIRADDEIGEMGRSMNSMLDNLRAIVGKIRETSGQVASAANQISDNSSQLAKAAHSQASASEETSSNMLQMAASIQTVAESANSLAGYADEFSSSIQEMGASSEQVARSADIMATSVSETSSTIEKMTVSNEQVAGSSQVLQQVAGETAVIVEQMAVSIRQVAKNVADADNVAKVAAKEGYAGQQAVQEALAAMQRVAEVIELTAASIVNLGKHSNEIGNIVKVINDIADQTNLLALNATIEAAQAGDAGRGFAVVADEVRKLAKLSFGATKEIGQVIKEVQADTEDSVKYGQKASREARASMELSAKAGNTLANIVKGIEQTSSLMSDISTVTAEHANASSQVLKAVDKMRQSTALVASSAREQAQGNQQIRLAVNNMNQVTQQVNLATREQAKSAKQIVASVDGMASMTQQVANATAEQRKGGEMVVKAVENISELAQENLSSVELLVMSAEELSQQAMDLKGMVAKFRIE
ncbi:methyl-accepting chemotaxis sensory transducer, class 40+24H [Geotalea daltonii FRC-32]|uniref:Methyl-accepting chemotaxis sensory transducer, class 40+24H n=1 Tax=Geotalea daltonii (strain DSM 22248 / JCM 15807 / FRC-32) TaxID=316067 RepID=B9M8A6_GEODF|nr:methyl-accepting chemotaxis protein [Geotalea daltonii]ACM20372.1 methyl-accepting chemotaxis sensory transducer, class 40+24H [Geotalea daltonii FRC-32]